jgi:hypothetical protein
MFFVIANHFSQQLRGGNLVQREEPLPPLRVVGLDGKHVGMVDHLETADRIILSKEQPASSHLDRLGRLCGPEGPSQQVVNKRMAGGCLSLVFEHEELVMGLLNRCLAVFSSGAAA